MSIKSLANVAFAVSLLLPAAASGQVTPAKSPEPVAIPKVLDPEYRHRKTGQVELTLFGGTYLGASIKKSWISGARAYYHLNNMFALGASYGYQWTAIDTLHASMPELTDRHTHFINGEVGVSNDVAMRIGGTVVELDLYMTLGVGAIRLDGDWDVLGVIGGGLKAYPGISWLAIRIDVNNYLHRVRKLDGDSIDMDPSFSLGVSFLLPPDPSPRER